MALSGRVVPGGSFENALISNFEILNLVPTSSKEQQKKPPSGVSTKPDTAESTKWRRVGLVLGRKVHLDTIVW